MLECCSTCLSSDRRLTPLAALKPVLDSTGWLQQLNVETDSVCWECRGVLTRMQRFQRQVVRAQRALAEHRDSRRPALESLSTLSTYTVTCADESVLHEQVLKHEHYDNYEYPDGGLAKIEKKEASEDNNQIFPLKLENEDIEEQSKEETNKLNPGKNKKGPKKASDTFPHINKVAEKLSVNRKTVRTKETNVSGKKKGKNVPKKMVPSAEGDAFMHLTKQEKKFIVIRMSLEELHKLRDLTGNTKKYKFSRFKCETCLKCYTSKEQYETHLAKFHDTKLGSCVCPICSSRFPREAALRRHREGHFKLYRCRQCAHTNHRLPAMMVHANTRHQLETYPCEVCGEAFPYMKRLASHIEVMHRERSLTCKRCKKTFNTKHELKLHTKEVHYKGASEQCPLCGKMYLKLWMHLKLTHAARPGGEDAYCAECGAQFRNVVNYRNHLRLHPRHRKPEMLKYPCSHCEKRFTNNVCRDKHVASIHTRDFAFKCDSCDKSFNREDYLRNHVKQIHMGIPRPKDKMCTICGRGFTTRRILTHHIRTHTGEKPYACEQCGSAFAQKIALKSHVRNIHVKQRKTSEQ